MQPCRKIIHIDMDAFYAAVEQRDFPEYKNRPLVVGGDPFGRGVVATCSYEARKFGIHSAMPASRAYRLCPEAIFVRPRFEVYKDVSQQIRKIFFEYTDQVEPLSLDEAYLDVTDAARAGSAALIAKAIKTLIKEQTRLTASAGVSYNKFLAKIASDLNKPDGLYVITPEQGPAFVERLPVKKFHGVGNATARKMEKLGISTGLDLKQVSLPVLQQHFGKAGLFYFNLARATDYRPVVSFRRSQSVGAETTFQEDIDKTSEALAHLERLFNKALTRVNEKQLIAHTLTVKVKYHDFVQITRSRTLPSVKASAELKPLVPLLLKETELGRRAVRLLGITFSTFKQQCHSESKHQSDLFEDNS